MFDSCLLNLYFCNFWRRYCVLHKTLPMKTLMILICFWLVLLQTVYYFFFLYRTQSFSLCTVFNAFSSNIDQVLPVNPSPNLFVFEDNVHPRDWLTYSDLIGVTSFSVFFFPLLKTILFLCTVFDAFFINCSRFSQPILLLIYLSLEI